jgi:hypothetical protein
MPSLVDWQQESRFSLCRRSGNYLRHFNIAQLPNGRGCPCTSYDLGGHKGQHLMDHTTGNGRGSEGASTFPENLQHQGRATKLSVETELKRGHIMYNADDNGEGSKGASTLLKPAAAQTIAR